MTAVLVINNAAKRFGGVHALVDANLTLYPGEIHALLGENGAGKSTLLKTLAGVHKLDSGRSSLRQLIRALGTKGSLEQGIAVIYQEPSLFPDLTLAENVFVVSPANARRANPIGRKCRSVPPTSLNV